MQKNVHGRALINIYLMNEPSSCAILKFNGIMLNSLPSSDYLASGTGTAKSNSFRESLSLLHSCAFLFFFNAELITFFWQDIFKYIDMLGSVKR